MTHPQSSDDARKLELDALLSAARAAEQAVGVFRASDRKDRAAFRKMTRAQGRFLDLLWNLALNDRSAGPLISDDERARLLKNAGLVVHRAGTSSGTTPEAGADSSASSPEVPSQ